MKVYCCQDVDSDWADYRMANGCIAWTFRLMHTVTLSSTAATFMAAYDTATVILFMPSILWDPGIPEPAATLLYEDDDACTAMAMATANKPTSGPRHMDISHFALIEWVGRDLVALERVSISLHIADHFSTQFQSTLFTHHVDWILGHVPPTYSLRCDLLFGSSLYPTQQTTDVESPMRHTHSVSHLISDFDIALGTTTTATHDIDFDSDTEHIDHGHMATTNHDHDIDSVLSCAKKLIASWSFVTGYRVSSSTLAFSAAHRTVGGCQERSYLSSLSSSLFLSLSGI